MKLNDVPESELVRLSQNTRVKSYMIGFATTGTVVLWKLQFENGNTELFFLAPAVAVHFTKGTRRAARKHKWPASDNWPDHTPEITESDWDFLNSKFDVVTGQRTVAFRDGLVSALQIGKDLFQVIRLSPEHAVQIADLHWEQMQNGMLRDIAAEPPASGSRH